MAVEVCILSGARQGEQFVLDANKLRAGSDPACEIYFDPSTDSAARDRSLSMSLMDDGWYIQSTGQGEVFVNQNPVVGLTRLRSGSIVRMSEFGPEFEFRILARAPAPADRPALVQSAGLEPGESDFARPTSPAAIGTSRPASPVLSTPVQEPARPAGLAPVASDNGRLAVMIGGGILLCMVLAILVKVMTAPPPIVVVQPSETAAAEKSPAEKGVVEKQPDAKETSKETAIHKDVPSSDQAAGMPGPKKADPLAARLKDAVLLIQVEKAGQFWPFATCVAVSEDTVLTSAREALQLGVWMRDRRSGFKGWVTNPATGLKLPVQETRLYAVSVGSPDKEKPNDWLYTNLGLATVQGVLPKIAELAGPEELAQLAPGKAIHAYCYVHEGDLITPEDHFEPKATLGKVLFINVHPELPGKPRLLAVKADLPKFPLGSPLVNAQGKVVAVYSDPVAAAADAKDASPGTENMHYATVVHPGVVDLWVKNSDRSAWMSTADLKIPEGDSKASKAAAKTRPADSKTSSKKK